MTNPDLKAAVPGSFDKYKPEIDGIIDAATDLGVTVLAPDKGWLYLPPTRILDREAFSRFRPLPTELGMSIRQIEESFLNAIARSDFIYIVNPDGFIGDTVAFELGFALASQIDIYSKRPITPDADMDLEMITILSKIPSMNIEDAVRIAKKKKSQTET